MSIPARLHNSLIGTKGRLIRSIMEECGGVHIHFPVEGSGSDTVVIRGPSSDVEKARKQLLHLAEEKVSAERGGLPSRPAGGLHSLSLRQVGAHLCTRACLLKGLSRPEACMFSGENLLLGSLVGAFPS